MNRNSGLILILSFALLLLVIIGCKDYKKLPNRETPLEKPAERDVSNTLKKDECITNADCITGGCSGTLCHKKGENIFTTCEYLPEYSCYKLISCGCVNDKCQWGKTQEFDKCLKEKHDEDGGVY